MHGVERGWPHVAAAALPDADSTRLQPLQDQLHPHTLLADRTGPLCPLHTVPAKAAARDPADLAVGRTANERTASTLDRLAHHAPAL